MYSRAFQSFDSIRQSDKFAACTLIFKINSNGGEFDEGLGGVFTLWFIMCPISIKYTVSNKLKTSKVLNAANNDVSLFFFG